MTTLQDSPTDTTRPDAADRPKASALLRPHVIGAVFRRDFMRFFFNPAGYVFIALFVIISAVAAVATIAAVRRALAG